MDLLVVVGIGVFALYVINRLIHQRAAAREAERNARHARASKALADAMTADMEARVAATLAAQSASAEVDRMTGEPDHLHQMLGRQLVDATLRHQREEASPLGQIEIDRELAENGQAQLDLIDRLIAGDVRPPALPVSGTGSALAGR
jgi:hypothetical protein